MSHQLDSIQYTRSIKEYWSIVSEDPRYPFFQSSEAEAVKSPAQMPWTHYAWGLITPSSVQEVDKFFGRAPYIWWVPEEQLDQVGYLEEMGLTPLGDFPDMTMDLKGWSPSPKNPHIQAKMVMTEADLQQWITVCAEGFGMPRGEMEKYATPFYATNNPALRLFLGSYDGKPVGVSKVHIGSERATVYWVGTLEAYRKRGMGKRMVEAALEYALTQGSVEGMLNAFAQGKSLYESIGFQVTQPLKVWIKQK